MSLQFGTILLLSEQCYQLMSYIAWVPRALGRSSGYVMSWNTVCCCFLRRFLCSWNKSKDLLIQLDENQKCCNINKCVIYANVHYRNTVYKVRPPISIQFLLFYITLPSISSDNVLLLVNINVSAFCITEIQIKLLDQNKKYDAIHISASGYLWISQMLPYSDIACSREYQIGFRARWNDIQSSIIL